MKITNKQKNELNSIFIRINITIFGSSIIPDKSLMFFNLFNININDFYDQIEKELLKIMNSDGMINGIILQDYINKSQYKELFNYLLIPKGNFYLSNYIIHFLQTFIPGIIN